MNSQPTFRTVLKSDSLTPAGVSAQNDQQKCLRAAARSGLRAAPLFGIFLLVVTGCSRSNDQQFADRVQLVRDGKSNVIDIRDKPLSANQVLEQLGQTVGLRKLNLDNSPITDDGLRSLGLMPDLRELSLTRTLVTDAALPIIVAQFPSLDNLRLDRTAITDTHLDHLSKLTALEKLSLFRTRITDGGCPKLAKISSLKSLSLAETRVTDVGLAALHEMPLLESVSVWKTTVTDDAIEDFSKVKSTVKVSR